MLMVKLTDREHKMVEELRKLGNNMSQLYRNLIEEKYEKEVVKKQIEKGNGKQ